MQVTMPDRNAFRTATAPRTMCSTRSSATAARRSSRHPRDVGWVSGGSVVRTGPPEAPEHDEGEHMALREVMLVVQKGDHSLGYYDFETGQELPGAGGSVFHTSSL